MLRFSPIIFVIAVFVISLVGMGIGFANSSDNKGTLLSERLTPLSGRDVVIATEGTSFEPFRGFDPVFEEQDGISFEVGRRLHGFEVQLLKAIFSQMGNYKVSLIYNYDSAGQASFPGASDSEEIVKSKGSIDFAALFPGLHEVRADSNSFLWDIAISTTGITQARRDKYNIEFSSSYFTPIKHFFGSKAINNFPNDLAGSKIGAKAKTLFSAYANYLKKYLEDNRLGTLEVVDYDDVGQPAFDKIFSDLKKGNIHFTLSDDELLLKAKSSDSGLSAFNIVGPDLFQALGHEVFGEGVGVAFRNDDLQLIEDFNQALAQILANCGPGGYKDIYERYFKVPSPLTKGCD